MSVKTWNKQLVVVRQKRSKWIQETSNLSTHWGKWGCQRLCQGSELCYNGGGHQHFLSYHWECQWESSRTIKINDYYIYQITVVLCFCKCSGSNEIHYNQLLEPFC